MAVKVELREGEDFEGLIKRFKKQVALSNVMWECTKHESFVKKSLARQIKAKENKRRAIRMGWAPKKHTDKSR